DSAAYRVAPAKGEIERLARRLRALGVESIAVGFLHSYLDPENERQVGRALEKLGIPVTLSHVVSGEYREYERFSTAIANAALRRVTRARIAGLPVRAPMIEVWTGGAGGGSIARRDAAGALRVGPESAGADPGPACYGRGDRPTVTDAHILLGRLGAEDLLGG